MANIPLQHMDDGLQVVYQSNILRVEAYFNYHIILLIVIILANYNRDMKPLYHFTYILYVYVCVLCVYIYTQYIY